MTDRIPSDLATCSECGSKYSVGETLETNSSYFPPPYDYERGSSNHCLACWLGVGARDFPSSYEGSEDALASGNKSSHKATLRITSDAA